jgi:hypothetical protein
MLYFPGGIAGVLERFNRVQPKDRR